MALTASQERRTAAEARNTWLGGNAGDTNWDRAGRPAAERWREPRWERRWHGFRLCPVGPIPAAVLARRAETEGVPPPPQPNGRQPVPAPDGPVGVRTDHCGYARSPAGTAMHPELAGARPRDLFAAGLARALNVTAGTERGRSPLPPLRSLAAIPPLSPPPCRKARRAFPSPGPFAVRSPALPASASCRQADRGSCGNPADDVEVVPPVAGTGGSGSTPTECTGVLPEPQTVSDWP
jgi:hypothetical protein